MRGMRKFPDNRVLVSNSNFLPICIPEIRKKGMSNSDRVSIVMK